MTGPRLRGQWSGNEDHVTEAPRPDHVDTQANDDGEEETRVVEQAEDRVLLEALRAAYVRRLHRQSDDFDATRGLRIVTAKLQRATYGPPVVTRSS